jgi:DUF4097 and DUF4098 domain-containing protein YvlB
MTDIIDRTFHTPDAAELEINIPVGEIEIETVDGEDTHVVVEGSEKMLDVTEVRQEGRRVVVELKGKKPFGITISIGDLSFAGGSGRLRVRAHVPHAAAVEVASASADTKIRGRLRTLDAKTASGDLTVRGEIETDASVKTVSGDATLDRIHGSLRFTSVSGDVSVREVGRDIEGKSVSGDVRIDATGEGRATLQSVSGDIEIGVRHGTFLDVDAGSVSGDLNSEIPLGGDPTLEGGDGPTLVLRGKTVSGDFRVTRAS